MQHRQYTQQPWAESAHPGVPAVQTQQTPQQTQFQQPTQFEEPSQQQFEGQPQFEGRSQFQSQLQPQSRPPLESQPQFQSQPQPQSQPTPQRATGESQQAVPQQVQPQQVQPQVDLGVQQPPAKQPAAQPVTAAAGMRAGTQPSEKPQTVGTAAGTAGAGQSMAGDPTSQVVQQLDEQSRAAQRQRGLPSVDVHETPDDIVVYADVPGCTPDDVDLLANDDSITLVAKRTDPALKDSKTIQRERTDEVERTITLPSRANVGEAEATIEDGVCRITLPKREGDRKKRIGIQ